MAEKAAVLTPFVITQEDGNITEGSDPGTGVWGDLFKYQVPQGTGIILQAGDQFSIYLADDASTECSADELYDDAWVKIEVRDPSEQDKQQVFGTAIYKRVREFENRNLIAKLQVVKPVKVYPRQWIIIMAKDTGTIDVTYCYFHLLTSKVSIPLG